MADFTGIYKRVYALLDSHSLTDFDCGELCGKLCCCYMAPQDKDGGMELFPGEEDVFPLEDEWHKPNFLPGSLYEYPPHWKRSGLFQIQCLKPCPREKRPVNCRLFPLQISREGDKYFLALTGAGGHYKCPLVDSPQLINPDFIESAKAAASLLLTITEFRDLVDWDSNDAAAGTKVVKWEI